VHGRNFGDPYTGYTGAIRFLRPLKEERAIWSGRFVPDGVGGVVRTPEEVLPSLSDDKDKCITSVATYVTEASAEGHAFCSRIHIQAEGVPFSGTTSCFRKHWSTPHALLASYSVRFANSPQPSVHWFSKGSSATTRPVPRTVITWHSRRRFVRRIADGIDHSIRAPVVTAERSKVDVRVPERVAAIFGGVRQGRFRRDRRGWLRTCLLPPRTETCEAPLKTSTSEQPYCQRSRRAFGGTTSSRSA
jgi:hypothetical protein